MNRVNVMKDKKPAYDRSVRFDELNIGQRFEYDGVELMKMADHTAIKIKNEDLKFFGSGLIVKVI